MLSLTIPEASGHVQIDYDDNSLKIDLLPQDGRKANSAERTKILEIAKELINGGTVVNWTKRKLFGKLETTRVNGTIERIPENVVRIEIINIKPAKSKKILQQIISNEVMSHHLLFSIDRNGHGSLVQKSSFEFNDKESKKYAMTKPMAGG